MSNTGHSFLSNKLDILILSLMEENRPLTIFFIIFSVSETILHSSLFSVLRFIDTFVGSNHQAKSLSMKLARESDGFMKL
jgi:hypothetical protein